MKFLGFIIIRLRGQARCGIVVFLFVVHGEPRRAVVGRQLSAWCADKAQYDVIIPRRRFMRKEAKTVRVGGQVCYVRAGVTSTAHKIQEIEDSI
jgi:hypothetical protein